MSIILVNIMTVSALSKAKKEDKKILFKKMDTICELVYTEIINN